MHEEFSPLMTADEIAKLLKIKKETVYRWAKTGKIPSIRLGRLTRFREADLRELEWTEKD